MSDPSSRDQHAAENSQRLDLAGPQTRPTPVKVVVAGGFAVGKTTFVSSISDIDPLRAEANMTAVADSVDDLGKVATKQGTTVAMDFGRVQLGHDLILYVYGTPGQSRFDFMWNELLKGAIGAVVLVDTTRLTHSFAAIDLMEQSGVPFIVAINAFDGILRHHPDDVRSALDIAPYVPVVVTDARSRSMVRDALVGLVRHAIQVADASARASA